MDTLTSQALVRLLATEDRRRIFAALVLEPDTLEGAAQRAGLTSREALAAMDRLMAGGLVERSTDGTHVVLESAFLMAARTEVEPAPPSGFADETAEVAKILDQAFVDGRLVAWPAKHSRRLVVLDWLVQRFEPGQRYTEKQINAVLSSFTEDTATMRRYLIDGGFLDRGEGEYWRSGGTV